MRLTRILTIGGLLLSTTVVGSAVGAASASAAPVVIADETPGRYVGQAEQVKPAIPDGLPPQVSTSDDEIAIREPRKGGGLAIRIYHLAPGASAAQVLTGLRARGLVPAGAQTRVVPDWIECTTQYGSAKYLCLRSSQAWLNWRWNGFDDPQVYFRDTTPAAWPVRASVTEWNRSPGVDSYWTQGACPTGGRHCVPVSARNDGPNGIVGETEMEVDSAAFFIDGTVRVRFNTAYSSADDNRGTVCHELGHALGLAHNGSRSSCLFATSIAGPDPRLPHSTDFSVLQHVLYRD